MRGRNTAWTMTLKVGKYVYGSLKHRQSFLLSG
jgi:hypothetical protein